MVVNGAVSRLAADHHAAFAGRRLERKGARWFEGDRRAFPGRLAFFLNLVAGFVNDLDAFAADGVEGRDADPTAAESAREQRPARAQGGRDEVLRCADLRNDSGGTMGKPSSAVISCSFAETGSRTRSIGVLDCL